MAFGQKHCVTLDAYSAGELTEILDLAVRQKADAEVYRRTPVLKHKAVGLVFEKPSLRTRLSFEVAIAQLGGQAIYLGPEAGRIGEREPVLDFAKVGARYLDGFVLRVHEHVVLEECAKHGGVPVINALSDDRHPCQALGDMLTIREKLGKIAGTRIAYVGDPNNVCKSLAVAACKLGAEMVIASPHHYRLDDGFQKVLKGPGKVREEADPQAAVAGADAVYTDVWTSMGQEEEADARARVFRPYQLNEALMAKAPKAVVMHCLPAHRGEEVTEGVIDGPQSVVYDQAENRLHAQRALMTLLFA